MEEYDKINSKLSEKVSSLSGDMTKLLLTMIDMESDKASLMLQVLELSTDGFWDWHIGSGKNGDEDYEYLSPKLKMQLGYEDGELENKPSSWQKICNPDDMGNMFQGVQAHFDSKGKKEFITECRYTHKKGHLVVILCRGNVIEWNEDGSPKRMVGTHTDVTNLKK
jgi:PAS domain S-box-containing protein